LGAVSRSKRLDIGELDSRNARRGLNGRRDGQQAERENGENGSEV
jgi:hypothetical protein